MSSRPAEQITRAVARAQGLAHYFTGKPCINGHLSKRYASYGGCFQCADDAAKIWQAANRDKIRASCKAYYENNKTKALATRKVYKAKRADWYRDYWKNYAQKNKEKKRGQALAWKLKRSDAQKARDRLCKDRWSANNPERERAKYHAARARRRGAGGRYTPEDIQKILITQGGRCVYCQTSFSKQTFEIDHALPLSLGGSNWPENIQLLCGPCNRSKGAKHPDEFAKWFKLKAAAR